MRTFSDIFRSLMQVAYVAEDLDAAADWFESTLGTVPCRRSYRTSFGGVVLVDGEPADEFVIDIALVNAGPTNLEIIRPVSGAVDMYLDALRPEAPATFHHLGFRVDDFDEVASVVAASGRSWKQLGALAGLIRFGYVDMTAELGHYIEVMECGPPVAAHFAQLEAESNRAR